jgi:hypothetical protein
VEKKKRMVRKVSLLILPILLALVLALPVRAQSETSFSNISVELWPEFDRPTVLVMYQMTLSPQVSLPAVIKFRIPANAGAPNAVAVCQTGSNCYDTQYTQAQEGVWNVLSIQATLPELRVEYYDPGLQKNGASRHYTYTWPGDYAVDSMKVSVQQPAGAENMQLKPDMFKLSTGENGLNYYDLDAGALPAGQTFSIDVDYQKSSDELTQNNLPVAPSDPLNSTESGRASLTSALPIVLGLVGLLLIVGGGVWYWRSGRQRSTPRREHHRRRASGGETAETKDNVIYCHQCGKRASPGDRFCRDCGTTLRIP